MGKSIGARYTRVLYAAVFAVAASSASAFEFTLVKTDYSA